MKHVSVHQTPKAVVMFSEDEILRMIECSKRHYDANCRAASNKNGSLTRMLRLVKIVPDYEFLMEFDSIDLLAKVSETEPLLSNALAEILDTLNRHYIKPVTLT